MMNLVYISLAVYLSTFFYVSNSEDNSTIQDVTVQELLIKLGDKKPIHYIDNLDSSKIEKGKQLLHNGFYIDESGEKSKRISKYFVCTDCHTTVREHSDLSSVTADDRLDYAMKNNLPYLPGSTFWGITNREQWYTKDYLKKYGDLVVSARDTLANSVQLCAKECSSGRHLDDWEEEAIMHYLQTLELKVSDINLEEDVKTKIDNLTNLKDVDKKDLIEKIKSKYTLSFQATFSEPKSIKRRKEETKGDVVKGEYIYKNSCLYCHSPGRVTNFVLQDLKLDKAFLKSKVFKHTQFSIYEVVRHGFGPLDGMRQYMPLFPQEKLSDKQLEDLVTYLNSF